MVIISNDPVASWIASGYTLAQAQTLAAVNSPITITTDQALQLDRLPAAQQQQIVEAANQSVQTNLVNLQTEVKTAFTNPIKTATKGLYIGGLLPLGLIAAVLLWK